MDTPTPEMIKSARLAANLTQHKSANMVHVAPRTWQQWEAGDRAMPKSAWELFQIKSKGDNHD